MKKLSDKELLSVETNEGRLNIMINKNDKLDIVILGGQSNAEGYGIGDVSEEYSPDESVYLLTDNSVKGYLIDDEGNNYLKIDESERPYFTLAREGEGPFGKVGKLPLFFAKEYTRRGLLKNGRKLLIVAAAVGGTGFSRAEWNVGCVLYRRLINLTRRALEMNCENRVVAFLWHQGEHDAFENPLFTPTERYRKHYYNLRSFMERTYAELNVSVPFIAGGFCDEWYYKNKKSCDAVLKAIKDVCHDVNGAFVSTHGLLSNNQKMGNGDDIHFCRESLHILGKQYFNSYLELIK